MTTEDANNNLQGGNSDDPESDEIPECESDFESLSMGSFETFCETFLRSAIACLSETGFPDGFSRLGSNFPGMERDFDLSDRRRDFLMGGVAGRLRKERPPMGQKYKEEPRLQSYSPWSAQSDSWVGHGRI
jgi:hypothetical protein